MYLRQSTASQTRTIGPFVDDTDFKTLKNALTIANTDILLKKNGAASGAKNSGGATADGSGGMYSVTFDATDTSTVGELFGSVKVANSLVVPFRFVVLEEAVYDALFAAGATAVFSTDVVSISGDSVAADNLESYLDGTNFMPVDAYKPVFSVSGATLTVKKPDGTTTAYTKTLTTNASADPVVGAS